MAFYQEFGTFELHPVTDVRVGNAPLCTIQVNNAFSIEVLIFAVSGQWKFLVLRNNRIFINDQFLSGGNLQSGDVLQIGDKLITFKC